MLKIFKCENCGNEELRHLINSVAPGGVKGKTDAWLCPKCHHKNEVPILEDPLNLKKNPEWNGNHLYIDFAQDIQYFGKKLRNLINRLSQR